MRGATLAVFLCFFSHSISIHAPHAGSDCFGLTAIPTHGNFNPRPPCGERHRGGIVKDYPAYFNPRPPCGERRLGLAMPCNPLSISIHAPHAGSDFCEYTTFPTPKISIHAPHAGSDGSTIKVIEGNKNEFQSTPPMRGATRLNI